MVLFPDSPAPVGTDRGENLVSVSLGDRGGGLGGKACEGVGDPGHMVVPTRGPGLPRSEWRGDWWGGAEWPGSGDGGGSPGPYPAGVISRLWRR